MNNTKLHFAKKSRILLGVMMCLPLVFLAQFTQTFTFTGSTQTFVVPNCVTSISMTVRGAQGAGNSWPGGYGGLVRGVASVTAGQILYLFVGGEATVSTGGYNGGGSGGTAALGAGKGGGGASDVRTGGLTINDRIIVGGGGGGSNGLTTYNIATAGNGGGGSGCSLPFGVGGGGGNGGTAGGSGSCSGGISTSYGAGGGGGGLTSGGALAGSGTGGYGQAGSFGQGGNGGDFAGTYGGGGGGTYCGGGGGGGYYGGAGGMSVGAATGGGGGGSSYCDNFLFSNVSFSSSSSYTGNGQITFSYNVLSPISVSLSAPGICSGNSATISASGSQSYTWSNNSFGSSLVVSPTVSTSYSVAGSNSLGCVTSSVLTVNVYNGPPNLSISGNSQVCLGQTLVLTASGAVTYTWTNGYVNGQPFVPTLSGNYVVTGQNACGTTSAATNVTVTQLPVSVTATSPTVCLGGTVALTGNATANSFTWQPSGSLMQTAIVSPSSTTIYTLTVNNGTCLGHANYTINTVPGPTIVASNTGSTICAGFTTTLYAVGGSSYTWSPGGQTGTSVVVSPLVPTQYVVTVEGLNGCTAIASQVIFVQPGPTVTALAASAALCLGSTTTLTATGANSFTWSTGTLASTLAVNPTASAVYSVTGSYTNGCKATGTVDVFVLSPTLSISGNTFLCKGQISTLTANGAGTYTWSNGFPYAAISISPTINTVYSVMAQTFSNAISCNSSASVMVIVNPLPTVTAFADRSLICVGESVTLTATGADTYSWSFPPTNLPSFTLTPTSSGTSSLQVVGAFNTGCTASALVLLNIKVCNGLQEWGGDEVYLKLYPNPAIGNGFYLETKKDACFSITDVNGKMIRQVDISKETDYKIHIIGLLPGVYFISSVGQDEPVKRKLIVTGE